MRAWIAARDVRPEAIMDPAQFSDVDVLDAVQDEHPGGVQGWLGDNAWPTS
jgi:hypothetical protein